MSFLSEQELAELGLASFGQGVKISRKASIYGPERISIGDHSRIDDFCVLSAGEGGITIGRYVHVAVMCTLMGAARIELKDFCGISARVCVYSSSDDYSGNWMTNPTVPSDLTDIGSKPVTIGRHAIIGAGTVILPGVDVADGAAVGALSLVKKDLAKDTIYSGVPAKRVAKRHDRFYALEEKLNDRAV